MPLPPPDDSYRVYLENELRAAAEKLLRYTEAKSYVVRLTPHATGSSLFVAIGSNNDILYDIARAK